MNTVAFDTLAFSKRLQEAGVPAEQAEAHAIAQADFLTHHLLSEVATKDDLKVSQAANKADLQALQAANKADLQASQAANKADLQALQAANKADLQASQAANQVALAELEIRLNKQIMKAAVLQFVLLGGLMAMFKFIG